jgi:glycosyltransferase-like protein
MPDALRIALFTHSVNPRGGVVHTLELAQALHAQGHAVTVFAPVAPGQQLFRHIDCAFEPIGVPAAAPGLAGMVSARINACVGHLAPRLAGRAFDVLHAQDSISANALATLDERGAIDGFVRTVHHLDSFDDSRLTAWQLRGFQCAREVLCVSDLWCERLSDDYGVSARRVHNGVDLARYTPQAGAADAACATRHGIGRAAARGPVFLAVGGIEARKNTCRVLDAFAMLKGDLPDAQLVIAGGASLLEHDAYAQAFRDGLRASGLVCAAGGDVVITGSVPDADMPALFRLADVLVMASTREGFGLVVLEALASGTPVVVSRCAPFTEYLGEHDAGWADPLDALSIAGAMHAACDPSRADALRGGVPDVCRRHSWQASAQRHIDIYRAGATASPCRKEH